MKLFIKTWILLFALFISFEMLLGQVADSVSLKRYSPDFKFKEGIYLNFEQLKNNDPIPKSRIVTSHDYSDPDFFDRVLSNDKIYYYDILGTRKELKTKLLWGYSRNGFVYINMKEGFFRITLIGSISHFVANHTSYSSSYSPYGMGMYSNPYYGSPQVVPNTEVRQYLLDFSNGRVLDYTDESLTIILMNDPELHDEYVALRRKKRKQLRYMYIRKYNQKHALYFPIN